MDKITVYTDGSALSNGRPGSGCGWACKLMYKGQARMKSGGAIGETNNRMEMQAVLEAMKSITDKTIPVEVYSDSNYVVETMNGHFCYEKEPGPLAETYEGTAEIYQYPVYMGKRTR